MGSFAGVIAIGLHLEKGVNFFAGPADRRGRSASLTGARRRPRSSAASGRRRASSSPWPASASARCSAVVELLIATKVLGVHLAHRRLRRSRSTCAFDIGVKTLTGDEILIIMVVPLGARRAGLVPAPHRRRHRRAGRGRERRPGPAARHPDPAPVHDRVDGRRRPGRPHLRAQGAVRRRHARRWPRRARWCCSPRSPPRSWPAWSRSRSRSAPASGSAIMEQVVRWNTSGSPTLQNVAVPRRDPRRPARSSGASSPGPRSRGTSSWSATAVLKPIPEELRRLPEVRVGASAVLLARRGRAFMLSSRTRSGPTQPVHSPRSRSCGR